MHKKGVTHYEKNVQEFFTRKQISSIAIAYAQGSYTYFNFRQQYGYESHVFYKILHLAVDKQIVSEAIARQMPKTAVAKLRFLFLKYAIYKVIM